MADRFYGYQYGTNPRKLNTEYTPYRNRYPIEEKPVSTNTRSKSKSPKTSRTVVTNRREEQIRTREIQERENTQASKKTKVDIKNKLKIVMFLIAGFSVLFAISYQNSLISESFNKKEQLKKEMEALSKTNQQLEVSIENNLNLNNIEQSAKEKIGMQKLGNNQKIYVNLPKQDYVAPAAEQIIIEENMNFFQKLIKGFTQSIK